MDSNDFAADRQTQAQTVMFRCVEGIEQPFHARGADADTGISNFNGDVTVGNL